MIKSSSEPSPYQTCFTSGSDIGVADSGGHYGFRPHELLEAAVATSMNMAIRIYADRHHITLSSVSTQVTLAPSGHGVTRFDYRVDIDGAISDLERRRLLLAARQCPIAQMLSGRVVCHDETAPALTTVPIAAAVNGADAADRGRYRGSPPRLVPLDLHDATAAVPALQKLEREQA